MDDNDIVKQLAKMTAAVQDLGKRVEKLEKARQADERAARRANSQMRARGL